MLSGCKLVINIWFKSSIEKLVYLKNFLDEKVSEYYKNYGIIRALEKSDKNEWK